MKAQITTLCKIVQVQQNEGGGGGEIVSRLNFEIEPPKTCLFLKMRIIKNKKFLITESDKRDSVSSRDVFDE